MEVTILLFGTCPICGYRNRGFRFGSLRPGMRKLTLERGSLVCAPWSCKECGRSMHPALYDQQLLDAETTAKLKAWQQRQRERRRERKAS